MGVLSLKLSRDEEVKIRSYANKTGHPVHFATKDLLMDSIDKELEGFVALQKLIEANPNASNFDLIHQLLDNSGIKSEKTH